MLLDPNAFFFVLRAFVPVTILLVLLQMFGPELILRWSLRHIPVANKKPHEWTDAAAKARSQVNSMAIMEEGTTSSSSLGTIQ